jgi:uncharacterized protein YoxC
MNDFLKQDIFFFITTVSVAVLTILLGVLLVYLIRIGRKVDYITDKAKTETDLLTQELANLRQSIRDTGFKVRHVAQFIRAVTGKKSKKN